MGKEKRDKPNQQPSLASFFKKAGGGSAQVSPSRTRKVGNDAADAWQGASAWRSQCQALLDRLQGEDGEGWFAAPVDAEELGLDDYFRVITEPMDLGTVQAKLERGGYADAQAFARDVFLVFENACRYNESPDHLVHQTAAALARSFRKRFQAAFPLFEAGQVQAENAAAVASIGQRSVGNNHLDEEDGRGGDHEDDESIVEVMAASGAGCATAKDSEGRVFIAGPGAIRGHVHPFFVKRSQQQAQKEEGARAAAAATISALAAEVALDRSSDNSPEQPTVAERTSSNSDSSDCSSSKKRNSSGETEDSSIRRQGGAKKRELTDEELLCANDYFLSQAQSKRKAGLLKAEADEKERQQRRQLLESFNKGKEIHPFFERPKAPSGGQGVGRGRDGGAVEDEREWLAPLFPTVAHVTQEDMDEKKGQVVEKEEATHIANVVIPRLTAIHAHSAREVAAATAADGGANGAVVDLDAEEAEEVATRDIMRWSESAFVRRKGNFPLLDDAGYFEPWAAGAQEAVEELAIAAGVYQPPSSSSSTPLFDHETTRQRMRLMKKQHDKVPAGTAVQWVDKYRPEVPNMLTWELKRVALLLQRWLESWQDWRAAAPGTQAKKKKPQRKKRQQEQEGEEDEEEMNEGGPRSTTLITGPPGCGKTALVYATAAKLGFEIIEVNTSQIRSGTEIKKLFSEATQSQHISQAPSTASFVAALQAQALPAPLPPATKPAKAKKGARGRPKKGKDPEKEEEDEVILLEHILPRAGPSTGRMTLILIEEVDLVFDEDAGFHRTLREFMLTAKWPLVLTANKTPLWLRESPACHIRPVEACPTAELAFLLGMIWATEGLPILPLTAFTDLARSFAGDVRSAIMNLQLWASRLSALQQQQQWRASPQLLPSYLQSPLSLSSSSPPLSLSLSPPAANPAAALHSNAREDDEGEEAVLEGAHRAPSAGAAAAADNGPSIFGYRCPVVESVRPFSGRLVGGTRITIKGQNFLQSSDEAAGTWAPVDVLVGHMPCSDVKVLSDDMIKATTPPCPPSLSSAANRQFPIVVRVAKFASNEAIRQLACHSSFLYQNKQRCIDELFPELKVPRHRLKRLAGALCIQQQQQEEEEEEKEEGETDERDEEGSQQGWEAKGSERAPPTRCGDRIASEEAKCQAKRRRVVLESDDDRDEDEEWEGSEGEEAKAQRDILISHNGSRVEGQEEGGGALTTTSMATRYMVLPDGTDSTQIVVGTTNGTLSAPEDVWQPEEEKVADGATATAAIVAVEDQDEGNDARSVAQERVWRQVLKPPSFKGQGQFDTAVLATLEEHAEALSCCDFLRTFAPGLDGDDFVQAPCSSLLRRGVTAQVQQDGEVSPWPQVPGVGDEVGNVLEAFLAQREQAVGVLLAAGGPRRGITFLHEAALAVGLRQEKAMGVVLPLLAPSFSLPYPTRRDVHLDYAPSLHAMQEADLVQNAGARISRRTRTYFTKVVEFGDVDEFREGLTGLTGLGRTGLATSTSKK